MFNNKFWGDNILGEVAIASRLAGHQSACGRWRVNAFVSLVSCIFFLPLSFTYSTVFHFFSCYSLPYPVPGARVSKRICGAQPLARVNPSQTDEERASAECSVLTSKQKIILLLALSEYSQVTGGFLPQQICYRTMHSVMHSCKQLVRVQQMRHASFAKPHFLCEDFHWSFRVKGVQIHSLILFLSSPWKNNQMVIENDCLFTQRTIEILNTTCFKSVLLSDRCLPIKIFAVYT